MKVFVIGAGAWGTTLSILFAENKHEVSLWVYEKELVEEIKKYRENKTFLPGFQLSEKINIVTDFKAGLEADLIVFVVPTQFLRSVAKQTKGFINPNAIVVAANKGIEEKSLDLPLDILKQELVHRSLKSEGEKVKKLAALSGPNLSKEIAKGLPAAAVVASSDTEAAKAVQKALIQECFRVYTSSDATGVQLGGALKNVIAIAAGVADGLNLGNNAKAGLLIRGIAEISRLGTALGAKPETFAGLSGMGDLITTCSSKLSRNHMVGEKIAKGKNLAGILSSMNEVAEGVTTCKAALALGKKYKIELPITQEVYKLLYEEKDAYKAISDLMGREAKQE